jgi:hypothetical protein
VPEPIRRTTARVVPVNRDGQVLLLHGCDPRRPDDLVGPYHRGFHEFSWNGLALANDSHFFAVRVGDVTVRFDELEPAEVGNLLDSGWFAPGALPDALSNADLPEVARLAVAAVGL